MRAGRDADAIREFRAAIPILMASSRENADDDDTTAVAARSQRLQGIVEAYLAMLAREKNASADIGGETFSLADAIRGRSVQQALAASSARAAAKDPALAELVRKEQDLGKQVNAQLGTLNNVLSLPSGERDDKGVQAINASINALRAARLKARQEIGQRFPAYADLVAPKPPSVEQIKATLTDGEAMLSFYFGQTSSFVWAVPKNGPVAFAAIKASSGDIESKVRKLREALEPQAAMISDIPPFDLKLAHELYSLLLQPVEGGWKPAKNLVLVTNGALGLLPLSLLPTAPAEIGSDDDPLFAGYKKVPWLARTHAVTTVPSAAALRTLRQLPPGKPNRGELIAFGDPYFSKEQEAEAASGEKIRLTDASGNTTRGGPLKRRNSSKLEGVDSAELAMLPRLPDTSDELKSIALALQADPSKVLQPRQAGQRAGGQDDGSFRIQGFGVRHPRSRTRRVERPVAAGAGAVIADGYRRRWRWFADHGGNPRVEARRRLGGAVGVQHRHRSGRRRRGCIGPRPRLFLCRHPRASGDQLVGSLAIGARTGDGLVQAAGARSKTDARRSATAGDDGAGGWPRLCRRRRQDRIRLRPSVVLGAVHDHRRWRREIVMNRRENMIVRILNVGLLLGSVAALTAGAMPANAAQVLITAEEAALPPPKGAIATERRGITRGPKVDVMTGAGQLKSPMRLQMKFEPYGGAKIDPDSVKMTYLRTPNVDLTSRVRSFVLPSGIDMPEVELPVGEHMVRVDIKDTDGRVGTTSFVLKVAPERRLSILRAGEPARGAGLRLLLARNRRAGIAGLRA